MKKFLLLSWTSCVFFLESVVVNWGRDTCCDITILSIRAAENFADTLQNNETWLGVFTITSAPFPFSSDGYSEEHPGLFSLQTQFDIVQLELDQKIHGEIPHTVFMLAPIPPIYNPASNPKRIPFDPSPGSRWILSLSRDFHSWNLPRNMEFFGDVGATVDYMQENAVCLAGDEFGTVLLHFPPEVVEDWNKRIPNWKEKASVSYVMGDERLLSDITNLAEFCHFQKERSVERGARQLAPLQTEFGGIMLQRLQTVENAQRQE